ncbi:F-box protein CPR30-like [Cucurbita moschata]|uniref:F-box protein CPR30-like n=1 Tax=Cucurbita moschata TaxID=3662 RepID=A0A6J1G1V6_CUCMO|nr:F-box protein CPR30-like [Cucurbita moschata]
MATLKNLPTELLIMILSRLPLKTLSSFKLVCKFWYALINDPTNCSLQHKSILLKHIIPDGRSYKHVHFILKFSHDLDRSISIINFDLPFSKDNPFSDICGHSHGLVCLSDDKDVFLLNPTTREFRKLPSSILHYTGPDHELHSWNSKTVGFRYDSKSKDFKVVRVVEFVHIYDSDGPTKMEIYDLRKDRWREIESPLPDHLMSICSFDIYHEGKYYWWSRNIIGSNIIQTFDISEEVFDEISVPDSLSYEDNVYISIGILNGNIVILRTFYHRIIEKEKDIYVWERKKDEDGVVSWSKLFTIGPSFGIERSLLAVSSDELLMETNERQLIFYNIKTQRVKPIPIKGLGGYFCATLFENSLVSVKGGHNMLYEF